MIDIDIEGLDALIEKLEEAGGGAFTEKAHQWLEAMGLEFLDIVQDEIIRTKTVMTRRLINSFGRGDSDNVFSFRSGGLELEVGTDLEYASFPNDGHMTVTEQSAMKNNPRYPGGRNSEGKLVRWVPGVWRGDRFEYDPNVETGMLLTEKFVPGTHYWESANVIFSALFERSLDVKLQQWIDEFFG